MTEFQIDPERGFLPATDPLDHLPAYFAPWEELARNLPKLLTATKLRAFVKDLPLLEAGNLKSEADKRRAMVLLSFIGHGYVWGEAETIRVIPAPLAVPWYQIAEQLGRPPVLSYASYALDNWRRIDSNGPVGLGNLVLMQNFLGGIDEEWFVIVHVAIEAKAAPALAALATAQRAVRQNNLPEVKRQLEIVSSSLETMHEILLRMPERCDPYIYYHRVRPYLHGWRNHPALPEGLSYEGVEAYGGQPQQFRGETGAQSSIVPSLDAGLGIKHQEDVLYTYLQEMRQYMPPAHRDFIRNLQQGPSIRQYVVERRTKESSLRDAYNKCIDWLDRFRSTHVGYAESYIQKQSRRESKNPTDVGTGGTPFMPYLRKHRNETSKHLIR
jgi:indoleamine 2,3-dioxygenase